MVPTRALSDGEMKLSEHIAELRSRLRVVFLFFVVALIVIVFIPANPVYQLQHLGDYVTLQFLDNTVIAAFLHQVRDYVLPSGWQLIGATGIGEGMEIYFIASILLASILSMPVIAYETYRFIDPALKEEERKLIYPFVISTSLLFAVGVTFGYLAISKFLFQALSPFFLASGTSFLIDSGAFYYVVFLIVGTTGLSFTAPVFIYALIRLRVLDPDVFSRNRVAVWFIVWVVTGLFLTPDGGPLLDLVIFVPVVALVEAAVFLGRRSVSRAPKPEKPRCKHCGAELPPSRLFCPKCGLGVA
jgi:sec-independent protein translocase protein TatC